LSDFFTRARNKVIVAAFGTLERFGLHVVPAHFHYPIPATRDLDAQLFDRISECVGVNWRAEIQREYLANVFPKFTAEIEPRANPGLACVDAAILHAMIRHHKPRNVVEVGSGHSTLYIAHAARLNEQDGVRYQFDVIDPYPSPVIRKGIEGVTRLRVEKIQKTDPDEFASCDLLFVDSSHVAAIGSDVTFLHLEVLPRLKPGCLVHFHDILMPGEYWKEWVLGQRFYWSEQYMLQAFLAFNSAFEIIWASRFMQLADPAAIQVAFPFHRADDRNQRISSLWIRRRPE
jgi:predicted O-methyltransferase YrrM